MYDQFNMWGLVILYKLNIRMKIINFLNKFKLSSFQDVEFLLDLPPAHNNYFYYRKIPNGTEFNQHIVCVLFRTSLRNFVSMDIAVANRLYK